jgi:hypothetical protein
MKLGANYFSVNNAPKRRTVPNTPLRCIPQLRPVVAGKIAPVTTGIVRRRRVLIQEIKMMPDTLGSRLGAQYEDWFKRLQAISKEPLDIDDWTGRWYDGYTPEEALDNGPDDD